jgi:hypothetical protein
MLSILLALVVLAFIRQLLIRAGILAAPSEKISEPYILIVGTDEEFQKVKDLLQQKKLAHKIAGGISVTGNEKSFVSMLNEAERPAGFSNVREVIFCAGQLSYKNIIGQIQQLKKVKARFFAGNSIIGSDGSTTKGEALSAEEEYLLAKTGNYRLKRLIDILFSLFSILFFPVLIFFVKKPFSFFKNCCLVLIAKQTWVGYYFICKDLPPLPTAVLAPNGILITQQQTVSTKNLKMLDYQYAKDYEPLKDVRIILKNYRYLGG